MPVHIEFPIDILDESLPEAPVRPVDRRYPAVPSGDLIDNALRCLRAAKRPVIYCGGGAIGADTATQLLLLAETLQAPVMTSFMGKGAFPEDHPFSLGSAWSPGTGIDQLLATADCILVIGSKLGVSSTRDFQLPLPDQIIRIDIDHREMNLNVRPTVPLLGDAAATLTLLNQGLDVSPIDAKAFSTEDIAAARKDSEAQAWFVDRREHVDALRSAIPRDGILVADMTMMSYVACELYPVFEPRTFFFPAGYGTLGFALPAAIGAKIGQPDRAVVCIVGDGGFQYTMAELGCAVQERLGIPIVIFNDSTYSAVKEAQKESREARYIAVDLVNPDYVKLADAYGIPGVRVDSPDALVAEIQQALTRDLPTIIDVPIASWV